MNNDNGFLGTEPVGRLLLKLSLPTIIAQIINLLYNLVDRVYVGHIPEEGSMALTGLGVCLPLIMVVSAFAMLVSAGGAPRASIAMGRGDRDAAEQILGNCFSLQLVISAVLTGVVLLFHRQLLLLFGASENTIAYAVSYMRVYGLGTVFVQLTLGMNAFIMAQGFTKVSMCSVLIGALCNIILDPIFIFLLGMGVQGAAWATVISQALSAAWILRFLTGKRTVIRLKKQYMPLQGKVVLPIFALGISPFVMQSSESVIMVCFNSSLLKYGGDIAVGAMTILSSVMQFSLLPMQGLSQGAQPITSYNYGAGNVARVKKTFRLLLTGCLTYSVLLGAAIMLFPGGFARMFTPDPELVAFTGWALRIYAGGICLMGIQIACQMTFIAIGNAGASVIVAVMRKFVLLLPLIYLVPRLVSDPTMGVYLAEPVADVIAVSFTAVLFTFQFRKAMKKLEKPAIKEVEE